MAGNNGVVPEFTQIARYLNSIKILPTEELNKMMKTMKIYLGMSSMDIDQAKKLPQNKTEADLLTRLVRRSIKRKEREKQQAREDFREAFEVLLESQDKSTKTQDLMLEELRNLNRNIDDEPVGRNPRRRQEPDDISDSSTDEESSVEPFDVDYAPPRPHMRLQIYYIKVLVVVLRALPIWLAEDCKDCIIVGIHKRNLRRNPRYLQNSRGNKIEYARRKTSSNVVDKYKTLNGNY